MCTKVLLCTVHLYEQNNVFLDCPEDGDSMLPERNLYTNLHCILSRKYGNRNDTPVLALQILHRIISAQFRSESFVVTDTSILVGYSVV